MNAKDSADFEAYLARKAKRRPAGLGFVGSAEGHVVKLHDDGTFDFKSKSGALHERVEDSRFHSYYASNH